MIVKPWIQHISLFGLMISFCIPSARSQNQPFMDSILAIIESPQSTDSTIAKAYEEITNYLIEQKNDTRALTYLRRFASFSQEAPYPKGMLKVNFLTAYYYYRRGQHDSVLVYTTKLANLATQLDLPSEEARALNRMAVTCNVMGRYDEARKYFNASSEICQAIGDSALQLSNFLGLATLEKTVGNYDLAINRYLEIDSVLSKQEHPNHYRFGLALHNIGLIHLEFMDNPMDALTYLSRAKAQYLLAERQTGQVASVNVEIARIKSDQGYHEEADSLLKKSLNTFRKIGHQKKLGETAMKFGIIKSRQGKFEEARVLLQEAKSVLEALQAPISLSNTYYELGLLHQSMIDNQKAIQYFKQALRVPTEANHKQKSLLGLSRALEAENDYQAAHEVLKSYVSNQDSINEAHLKQALQEANVKYESSQKEQEILTLQYTQAQQQTRNQRKLFAIAVLLTLTTAVAFVFYYLSRQRHKTNARLRDLDDLKSKLFANISHEFRTPLSLIKGPVDLVLNENSIDDTVRERLLVVQRNSERLTRLTDSVSELARLDAGKVNLKVRLGNLSNHLKVMAASFESLAHVKGCKLIVKLEANDKQSYYDPEIIETIVYNLLSNAFKYAPNGIVQLFYTHTSGQASISVMDDGPGLSPEDQLQVFDRYFRAGNPEIHTEGIGIGLALSHELAKLHQGKLVLTSEIDRGSTFTFSFATTAKAYSITVKDDTSYVARRSHPLPVANRPIQSDAITMHEDESVILLVEDNPDMRAHLQQLFSDDFRILLASNGQEGLALAEQFIPDLIISDLMMPILNGKEFLQKLRSDPKTSHIAFIMLTANQLQQEKLSSIQLGVDDYMAKPFSIEEIKLKVQNLIHLRNQLQKKYEAGNVIDPKKLLANDVDQKFWDQVKKVINENLDNADFSTEDFAKQLYMSRMQLHRKLKALTGQSAAVFMRTQRLSAAAKMLKENKASVAEVAFDVGFSSPFYFSKCFKDTYGMAPSDYAKA